MFLPLFPFCAGCLHHNHDVHTTFWVTQAGHNPHSHHHHLTEPRNESNKPCSVLYIRYFTTWRRPAMPIQTSHHHRNQPIPSVPLNSLPTNQPNAPGANASVPQTEVGNQRNKIKRPQDAADPADLVNRNTQYRHTQTHPYPSTPSLAPRPITPAISVQTPTTPPSRLHAPKIHPANIHHKNNKHKTPNTRMYPLPFLFFPFSFLPSPQKEPP